jgi:hypothetical protein
MPLNPQNKILIHHIQTKEYMHYIRPWKTRKKHYFMRHVQDFFKKKIRRGKSCAKITVAHGTSLAIYTEACTFRYMMNII